MFSKPDFAEKMVRRRKRHKMTAEQLASKIKVDRKTLSQWESKTSPAMPRDMQMLDRWCEELGLSLGEALDDRLPLDESVITDPVHVKAFRLWYARYTREDAFAKIIHKITTWDTDTLDLFNQIIARIERSAGREDEDIAESFKKMQKVRPGEDVNDQEPP